MASATSHAGTVHSQYDVPAVWPGETSRVADQPSQQPRLSRMLGLRQVPGLNEILAGKVPWQPAVQQSEAHQFSFISCGIASASAALDADRLQVLLRDLKR